MCFDFNVSFSGLRVYSHVTHDNLHDIPFQDSIVSFPILSFAIFYCQLTIFHLLVLITSYIPHVRSNFRGAG